MWGHVSVVPMEMPGIYSRAPTTGIVIMVRAHAKFAGITNCLTAKPNSVLTGAKPDAFNVRKMSHSDCCRCQMLARSTFRASSAQYRWTHALTAWSSTDDVASEIVIGNRTWAAAIARMTLTAVVQLWSGAQSSRIGQYSLQTDKVVRRKSGFGYVLFFGIRNSISIICRYYVCTRTNEIPQRIDCDSDLHFNRLIGVCDYPHKANCPYNVSFQWAPMIPFSLTKWPPTRPPYKKNT